MHSAGRGISASAIPYSRNPPSYVNVLLRGSGKQAGLVLMVSDGSRPPPTMSSIKSYVS
jgi:hypothetical protein